MNNTTLRIARILVTRPKLRRPMRSAQIVGVVVGAIVDSAVDMAVDVVADAKVTAINGAKIRSMRV